MKNLLYSLSFLTFNLIPFIASAVDTTAPTIVLRNGRIQKIQIGNSWIMNEPKSVSDNETDSASIVVQISWGSNGTVNSLSRGIYYAYIKAIDLVGNFSTDTIQFKVDDFIPPVINLNTPDKICVQHKSVYNRVQPSVSDNYYSGSQISLVLELSDVDVNFKGLYMDKYKAVDASGNETIKIRIVEVNDCNSSQIDALSIKSYELYPNPVSDQLFLNLTGYNNNATLKVYSHSGSLLMDLPLLENNRIDISSLEAGFYYLQIFDGREIHSEKIQIIR